MKKKRIVIFGWASSIHVQRWAKGLAKRGYDILVVSLGGEKIDGVETIIFPNAGRWSYYKYAKKAKKSALKFNPDIVHVHYAGGFGLWGVKTKFSPLVVSVWGSDIEKITDNFLIKRIVKKTLKKADVITATSNYLRNETVKLVSETKNKTGVIPFGVNLPNGIAEYPSDNKLKICFIKGFRKIYGSHILIDALKFVLEINSDVELNLAGNLDDSSELKDMIELSGLSNKVNFVGFINHDKMYDFINQHHLMVMPSLKEGFGVAALEASACGRPVIGAKVGGIPEVIIDGETGILVPSENPIRLTEAIIKLGQDMNLIRKMGLAGYDFVKNNYDWELSLDKMCDLYERVSDVKN